MRKTKTVEIPDVYFEKGDKKLEIYRELRPIDPRTYDNIGIMRCGHKKYDLGDEGTSKHAQGWEDVRDNIEEKDPLVVLSLYLLDHSGLSINTTGFRSMWDSGKVGFIYTTEERLKKLGVKTRDKDKLRDFLKQEVETYDKFLRGDIYRFMLYENGEQVDSCGGFYGTEWSENGLLEHAGIDSLEDWERTENR